MSNKRCKNHYTVRSLSFGTTLGDDMGLEIVFIFIQVNRSLDRDNIRRICAYNAFIGTNNLSIKQNSIACFLIHEVEQ